MKRVAFRAIAFAAAFVPVGLGATAFGQETPIFLQANPADDITRRLEQVQRETRLLASPDLDAGDRALLDYGGFLTFSYFSTDTSAGDNRGLRQYDLNLYARVNLDGAHEFYLRNRLQYRDYNDGDETATDDDGLKNYLEEGYYKFDLARYLAAYRGEVSPNNVTLTVGRQFHEWATGLTLSQYVDGISSQIDVGPLELRLLAGVTAYGTTDFDTSRPDFEKKTNRGFYGAMTSFEIAQHRPFVYALAQQDYNQNDPVTQVPGAESEFQYNSYYLGVGSEGNLSDQLLYSVEAVFEGGKTLSAQTTDANFLPLDQTKDDIEAWAVQGSLDYVFNDVRRSRIGASVIVASGDPDRGNSSNTLDGNEPDTTDRAFNALGLISAGYAFAPQVSNLIILRGSASTFPFGATTGTLGRLQLGTEVLAYGKTLRNAPIDEPTSQDRYLGSEAGVYLNWRILEDVTYQIRYAAFFPGDAIDDESVRQFLYTSITYSF